MVHQHSITKIVCRRKVATHTNCLNKDRRHKAIMLLLLCCGDVELNPGPMNTGFIDRFKPEVHSLIRNTLRIQKKFIDSTLHGYFLQQYQQENIPPPGLTLHKSPEISNRGELVEEWRSILRETSMRLNQTLIESHLQTVKSLGAKLNELRLLVLDKLPKHQKKLFTSWLQNEAQRHRNKGQKRKLKKFNRHVRIFRQQQARSSNTNGSVSSVSSTAITSEGGSATSSPDTSYNEEPTQQHSSSDINSPSSNERRRARQRRRTHRGHTLKEVPIINDDDDIIVNLSDYVLSEAEKSVLKKGLKFVPTPTTFNKTELMVDCRKYSRRVRLKEFFADEEVPDNVHVNKFKRSRFTPELGRDRALDDYLKTLDNTLRKMSSQKVNSNLTSAEREAIISLRQNDAIVIFPADKGGAVVIQNRSSYIKTAEEHLKSKTSDGGDVYQQLHSDCTDDIAKRVNHAIDEAKLSNVIDEDTAEYLKVPNPKAGNLYFLPKIHKVPGDRNPPGRPICNSKGTPTELISQWVDNELAPLVRELPSYLQDGNDFLHKIQTINESHTLPPDTILVTWDVKSLYTNIPTAGGVAACRAQLEKSGKTSAVINVIIKFINLILLCNIFRFANGFFLQKSGTAMGTRMAPNYANLFMGDLEQELLETYPKKPLVWYRYIDDVFFIWTHGREELDKFLEFCNNNRHGMVFETTEDSVSTERVPFLDVLVILLNGVLYTDLYTKPTDKFQYLNFKSSHPYHQKSSLPYSLALRIRRICSHTTDFRRHCDDLTRHLRQRGYKLGLIKEGIRKAAAMTREESLRRNVTDEPDERMVFSTCYNPRIPDLKHKLRELHPVLHSSDRCQAIFPHPPTVAYRRNRNLNDMLVSRRLPSNTNIIPPLNENIIDRQSTLCEECGREFMTPKGKLIHYTRMHTGQSSHSAPPVGFSKCNDKRCNTCVQGTFGESIHVTQTNETFVIKQRITCKTANLVYCITCKKCRAQYIGETEQELHARQRGHLSDIRLNKAGLPYVKHFRSCGIEHYTITGVEKVRERDPLIRKERELYYKGLFDVQIK